MEANRILDRFLLVGVLVALMAFSSAYDFYVGGKDGWVLNPSESYSDWAGRNRFQINDKLVFRYKKGEDSVLVVNKGDYDSCNVSNPIKKFDDSNSVFQFDRSGPFYFISGAPGKCQKGQKLIVVVVAVRNKKPSPSPPASPPRSLPPPTSPSPKTSISPAPSPFSSPSPSSPVSSPTIPPSPAPSTLVSSPSPAPVSSLAPSASPGPSTHVSSPSPAPVSSLTPIASPAPSTTVSSPSVAPSSVLTPPSTVGAQPPGPSGTPSGTTVGAQPPGPSGTPSGTGNASPSTSSSPSFIVSRVSVGLVAMVLGSALLG